MTRLHVLGFDADTGDKLWERQFWATGQTLCHPEDLHGRPDAGDRRQGTSGACSRRAISSASTRPATSSGTAACRPTTR